MAEAVHDAERLKELQALPLNRKVQITQTRIIEWYQHYHGNVCVSFSGGKDSTVLLHIARGLYPDIPVVFSNTGLEYPEIQSFVRRCGNVDIVTPTLRFPEVITQYGYPLISKEVAEAIYYARRIRSQSVQVERERERTEQRKRDELCGSRKNSGGGTEKRYTNGMFYQAKTTTRRGGVHTTAKRTEMRGERGTSTSRGRDADTNCTDSEPG